MKKEVLYEILEGLDENYINEAECYSVKTKKTSWVKFVSVAACFLLIVSGIAFGGHLFTLDNHVEVSLKVQAAEIGKEHMQFGATMPQIINVNDDKVIMYDYVGLWVYDMNCRELVGFCDFRPIDMTCIQGDPCVFVEATQDGEYVRFYMSDGSIKYLYDVKKNSYKQIDEYDSKMSFSSRMNISESIQISNYAETYMLDDGTYISYTLDIGDDSDELKYGDLIIITEKDGVSCWYRPFSTCDDTAENVSNEIQSVPVNLEISQPEQDSIIYDEMEMEAVEEVIRDYYGKTVFSIESMDLDRQTETTIVYTICASKDGVVQEPNRSIYLELKDGMWQVVNEGY